MMEIIKDIVKENWIEITTYVFIFLCGFGAGGAITDAINEWNPKKKQ